LPDFFDGLPGDWNITPSRKVLTIRLSSQTGKRKFDTPKWGLVPFWSKDGKISYSTINARVETVETSPAYRAAYKKRRCLVVADGFYEWQRRPENSNIKQPFAISLANDLPFVFAGLWETWQASEDSEPLHTCTIITCPANELMAQIHTRMPVILPPEAHSAWLSGEAGKEILVPYPSDRMKNWPISTRVNSPKNNDPELLNPI
jgi:putative SOS response-associated peptidase YedK